MIDSTLEHQIRLNIEMLKKNYFQDFIDRLLFLVYGQNYLPTRQYRDKGCDGVIENRTILAVYAPEDENLDKFKSKIKKDFDLYTKHWKKQYSEMLFIYNGEFTGERIVYCDSLDKTIKKWGIKNVLQLLSSLSYSKLREIIEYLNIDEQYFIFDVLKKAIEDLMRYNIVTSQVNTGTTPPNIVDKIKVNYNQACIDAAIKEYENIIPYLAVLKDVLKTYEDSEISTLKDKVLTIFGNLSGNYKTRLENSITLLAGDNSKDEVYKFYIKVVLTYFFEICLIGDKVN